MDELTKSDRLLLEAMQIEDSPRMRDADRVKERVLMSVGMAAAAGAAATVTTAAEAAAGSSPLAAPAAAAVGLGASSAVTTTASTAGTFGLVKALLVVGTVAGLGGGAVFWSWKNAEPANPVATVPAVTSSSDDARERVVAPGPARPIQEEADAHSAESTEDAAIPARMRKAASTPARNTARTSPEEDPVSRLKEEAQLLKKAQGALQQGDAATAISVLSEHKKKFPQGVLSGEREAALSVAYCMSGDLDRGRARAERFVAQNPKSPMVQRLKSACKLSME